jgi:hypothetical protein
MSYTVPNNTAPQKFLPKFSAMSAYQIYLAQVRSALEPIRATAKGQSYLPPQLGGLTGQLQVLNNVLVLQLIDFEVN